ncbi:hypothetical protein BC628DRAFT_1418451 [Trametes gibbosa]|nr:hypothetical protein BC628DRAFT_1418451 [Trametes gibbosa]
MALRAYLDIYIGDKDEHARAQTAHDATAALLAKNAAIYGLPTSPAALEEEEEEEEQILQELDFFVVLADAREAPRQAEPTVPVWIGECGKL